MKARLITIYILSLLDVAFTLYFQAKFGDIEANPFGKLLIKKSIVAIIYKVIIVGGSLLIIYNRSYNKLAVVMSWLLFVVFTLLTIYHIVIIGVLHYILFIE